MNYKYAESTVKPAAVEIGKTDVYLRKDITEDVRTDAEGNETTYYTYQEALVTPEEFNEYSAGLTAENASNIGSILNEQSAGTNNQMAIMEAIADLYDIIAELG